MRRPYQGISGSETVIHNLLFTNYNKNIYTKKLIVIFICFIASLC